MLPHETDFIGNAIGIDPSGCGCLECGNGSSIPEDETDRIAEAIEAHFSEGREIISRISCPIIVYRNRNGVYEHESIANYGIQETEIIKPSYGVEMSSASYSTAIKDDFTPLDEIASAVDVNDEAAMQELLEKHFKDGEELVNRTSEVLIVYRTRYGEYGYVRVDSDRDESRISVIAE